MSDPLHVVKLGQYQYPRSTTHTSRVGRFGDRVIAFGDGYLYAVDTSRGLLSFPEP